MLQPGTRLTWEVGDATTEGYQLVADPDGMLERNGQHFSVQTIRGSGGIGLEHVDIAAADDAHVAAEVRVLVQSDLTRPVYQAMIVKPVTGDRNGLGLYWTPPSALAALQNAVDGSVEVWRTTVASGAQQLAVVGMTVRGADHYETRTYDAATGVLLLYSALVVMSPGVTIVDDNGDLLDEARGSITTKTMRFVGARSLGLPWFGSGAPDWMAAGRTLTYEGERRQEGNVVAVPGVPLRVTHEFVGQTGAVVTGRRTITYASLTGPPIPSVSEQIYSTYSTAPLWIPPTILSTLTPNQMLYEDPNDHTTISFGGVQQNLAVIVRAGEADVWEGGYDLTTGTLVWNRQRQMFGDGAIDVIEVGLVG